MCVSIRYFVSGVIFFARSSWSMTKASVDSTYVGIAIAWWMAEGTAVNENALHKTLSSGSTPRHLSAMKSAEPQLLKPTAYLKPEYSQMASSARAVSERTPGV